ncbi:MAG: NAD-binding protein [Desulfuromonadales bacterium]|nr:NAD-binding protein [Desulfuromonadales bacterium]
MKTIAGELAYFVRGRARQNLKVLVLYCVFLLAVILLNALTFRFLMLHLEGREFTLIASVYWTITVMTTLGFGDITFHTDPGYLFASFVTLSGVVFLLILLPFGMVSLFLAPWIENRLRYRPTKGVAPATRGHVVICGLDPVTRALVSKLKARNIPFVVVTDKYEEALRLEEEDGMRVSYGNPADAEVLLKLQVGGARAVIANLNDTDNTNIILTVRSLCRTPLIALVDEPEHAEFLRLAGADQVIPLKKLLGHYLATRATTQGALAHVLDSIGKLLVAELPVHGTPFSGQSLAAAGIRERTGLAVVGMWERGAFTIPGPETILADRAVIVVVGTREHLEELERLTGEKTEEDLVLILGHGRIGCSAATFLDRRPVPFILVDRAVNPLCSEHVAVIGDATARSVLQGASIGEAKGLIVTTNDDGANIFLTLASRHLNPHIRIVSRANREENVDQLYAAGADFVVSNASVGANILMNILEHKESVFLTEGMQVFRFPVPPSMHGTTLRTSRLRSRTGSTVIALEQPGEKEMTILPSPDDLLVKGMSLIMIGSPEQEAFCRRELH